MSGPNRRVSAIGAAVQRLLGDKPADPATPEAILAARAILTPELVQKIANDEMPECFTPDRASYVAMAGLLLDALMLVENTVIAAGAVRAPGGSGH
jgi:hypothetical protein